MINNLIHYVHLDSQNVVLTRVLCRGVFFMYVFPMF
jgi:hypothetical protein